MPTDASRRPRSEVVHDRLRAAILSGKLPAGASLPSERALSEELAVNRHVVREAVKRLQQAGLVHVSQGGATRVLDWREHAGLDLLADLAVHADPSAVALAGAIFEMRATIGTDAARLCAQRAPTGVRDELRSLGAAAPASSYAERFEAYERLWAAIVDGSGNVAYRLAFNSLVAARHGRGIDARDYAAEVEDPAAARALVDAIVAGRAARAADLARELLERTHA